MTDPLRRLRPETRRKINRVAAERLAGKPVKEALKAAGYSPKNKNMAALARKVLAEHLDDAGLTDEELGRRIDKATRATHPLSYRGRLTGDEVPDNKARVRALELVCGVKGHMPGKGLTLQTGASIPVTITFGSGGDAEDSKHNQTLQVPASPPGELSDGPQ